MGTLPLSAAEANRRRAHWSAVKATRAELAHRFPACFTRKGSRYPKQPLALGITPTLIRLCPDLPAADIRHAVRSYCTRPSYLRALTVGAARVDQDGSPVGRVDEHNAAIAAGRLRSAEAEIAARLASRSPIGMQTETVAGLAIDFLALGTVLAFGLVTAGAPLIRSALAG